MFGKSLVLLSALTLAAPKGVVSFDPIEGFAPQSVSFDDRPGKGFEWNKPLPCGANRATVTVKFDKAYARNSAGQAPVAKVWLHSGQPGETSEQWIAAVLKAPTDTWKLNALAWLEKVTGTASESAGGYMPADLNRPLRIDFAWTNEGVVSVSFGGEFLKQAVANKPITGIGFGGSWAKFDFIDLRVGRTGTPDAACQKRTVASSSIDSDTARQ